MDKQTGNFNLWEVGNPKLGRFIRRMEGIRQDEHGLTGRGMFSGKHCQLTAPVRMTTRVYGTHLLFTQLCEDFQQTRAIALGIATAWWA